MNKFYSIIALFLLFCNINISAQELTIMRNLGDEFETSAAIEELQLQPLIEHNATPSGGCYVQDENSNVYIQLLATEIYLNIYGVEELFSIVSDAKSLPTGYQYGFQQNDTYIFVKELEKVEQKNEEDCINKMKYEILIKKDQKEFTQTLEGFCGC